MATDGLMMIEHIFAAGLILTQLLIAEVPFTHNPSPNEDGPQPLQRVALDFRAVPGMTVPFEVETRALVRVYGHLAVQLERCDHGERMMVTVGYQLDREWIDSGSKVGSNVDRDAHYHVMPFSWTEVVEPGRHDVRLMARAVDLDDGRCRAYFKPRQFSRMHVEVLEQP
ncbi:MAG: hypothetical protein ACREIR_15875 [Geminicoccaceae bacterium]